MKAAAQAKKAKKTVTEDDDDDWLDDLVIVERKVPEIEEYDDDDDRDEDYELEEEVNDDFEIPPLRARKTTQGDKSTDKSKKAKPSDAALEDLADFVERSFPKKTGKMSLKRKVDYETMTNRGVKSRGRHRWYDTPLSTNSRR